MHRHLSLEELPRKVAELGYEWIELSPRDDFLAWWFHPRANPERVASFKRALKDHGVKIASLLAMYRWASPHEEERRAAVRHWKKATRSPYVSDMAIVDTFIYEIDVLRWLINE